MMTSIKFYRALAGDERGPYLGAATRNSRGWLFLPAVSGHKPGRKRHSTWEACLPRWVNYPNGCMSERAEEAA
jgi:hypothetical protein